MKYVKNFCVAGFLHAESIRELYTSKLDTINGFHWRRL